MAVIWKEANISQKMHLETLIAYKNCLAHWEYEIQVDSHEIQVDERLQMNKEWKTIVSQVSKTTRFTDTRVQQC